MKLMRLLKIIGLLIGTAYACYNVDTTTESWWHGRNGQIKIFADKNQQVVITLSRTVQEFNVYTFTLTSSQANVYTYTIPSWKNPDSDGKMATGYTMQYGDGNRAEIVKIVLDGTTYCESSTTGTTSTTTTTTTTTTTSTTPTTSTTTTTTSTNPTSSSSSTSSTTSTSTSTNPSSCTPKYDYDTVLYKSLLFYEAQRSGDLPDDKRIPWRVDSQANDGDLASPPLDLSGGYYDAGDHVKFNFPAASAMTILAWGMLEYKEGYQFAGEFDHGLAALKWGMDYFIKCHPEPNVLWGQVGNPGEDHSYWGRAENLPSTTRECFKLTTSKPGSELAAETAAALAASSLVFQGVDNTYSAQLLTHAKDLYAFANNNRGKYSDSIPMANPYYTSHSGYNDELAWAAAWLHKADGAANYLLDAKNRWNDVKYSLPSQFSWDNKARGVAVLLSQITGENEYQTSADNFCNWLINTAPRTPQGMVHLDTWGANRHAANVAFLCLVHSKYEPTVDYTSFSRQQIHLMLGDAGRSFVVGYGNNPPQKCHHRGASCPDRPATCDWNNFHSTSPNPQVLNGALVGGPALDGSYNDVRDDYIANEVAIDYNAGFQSTIAGLLYAQKQGNCV